ncbi:protein SCO1/2 [Sulfitobacter brevis]|uniref:Protein SCO1/2 n=1 Tax=Sulfitobacter brevis TaxID=74348 RepID=A0A1I2B7G4_9RHOB|nr:hypothetical protein [Sulfitobacter brevis]SFE52132.1 protein SCO1/2 [Sulfitobacter brevis]
MRSTALALALLVATPALANHPGENLNQVMVAKEAAFEPVTSRPAPAVEWKDDTGNGVGLEELHGKIVAVSFVPAECGAPCADQQAKLAETLASLNASPMREMVQFVTLNDGEAGTPTEFENWTVAQASNGKPMGDLVAAFATSSDRIGGAPMIHLLDRAGHQVGIFHDSEFVPLNLILYINGLTNAHPHPKPGMFQRLFGWLL